MTRARLWARPLAGLLVAAALLAAVLVDVGPASGAPSRTARRSEITERLKSLREEVEEASAAEAELLDRFDAARDRRRLLDGRVAAVDRDLGIEQRGLDAAAAGLDAAAADLVRARLKLRFAQSQLSTARVALQRRAVAAYLQQPGAQAANVVLQVRSIRELSAARVYLRSLVRSQNLTVMRLRALRVDAGELQAEVEAKRVAAREQYDEVAARTARLEAARAEQEELRTLALGEEQEEQTLLQEVQSRKEQFEAEIAALQAESRSIASFLRARSSGAAPAARPGTLDPPIPFAVVTSPFGPRRHPVLGTVRLHAGIDLRAGTGTPVRAAANGVIALAGPRGGYGNTVIVDHGTSLATLSGHLQSVLVGEGQQVTMGEVIGLVGSTGLSTGPHLHFEVRVAGTPVDPLGYL